MDSTSAPLTVKLQKQRDRKEQQIDIAYSTEQAGRELIYRQESQTKKLLASYQKWKKENNVAGIKY